MHYRLSCITSAAVCFLAGVETKSFAADKKYVELIKTLRAEEVLQQTERLPAYKQQYTLSKNQRERFVAALALGAHFLRNDQPRIALQYLSAAKTLAGPTDPLANVISLYTNEAKLTLGATRHISIEMRRLLGKKISQDLMKQAFELLFRSYAHNQDYVSIVQAYEQYAQEVPELYRDSEILNYAATAFEKLGRYPQAFAALEEIAANYPVTAEAREAFKKLLQHSHGTKMPRYFFSYDLLKNLSINTTLDKRIESFVARQLKNTIRDRKGVLRPLPLNERVDYLLQFNLGDSAFALLDELKKQADVVGKTKRELFLISIARTHAKKQQHQKAAEYYDLYLKEFPQSYSRNRVRLALAEEEQKSGNFVKSATIFAGLSQRTRDLRLKWEAFWNTYLAKDWSAALTVLNDPLLAAKDANEPLGIKYWRGRLLEKQGEKEQAKAVFRQVLAQDAMSYYANLIAAKQPELLEEIEARNSKLSFNTFPVNPKLLLASTVLGPDMLPPAATTPADLRAIDDLIQAGLKADARKKLKNVRLSRYQSPADREFLGKLAWHLADFKFFNRLNSSGPNSVENIQTDTASLRAHQNQNPETWRLLYPLAYEDIIAKVAETSTVNKLLLLSIMRAESRYNREAQSPVGARGLMQIMPKTAIRISRLIKNPRFKLEDLYDPIVNLSYAGFYLNYLLSHYDDNVFVAIAAYNAGPVMTNQWINRCQGCDSAEFVESIPYKETRQYVKKVVRYLGQYANLYDLSAGLREIPKLPSDLPEDADIF